VWDVALRHGNLIAENHFRIAHKELDGDQINAITVHPEHLNQLLVHSRDNCIRLVEYESSRGPKVKQRFFGARCKDMPCLSTTSPDGQFIVSGSEDGKPRVWDTSLEQGYNTRQYECKLLDLVSDCVWNPRYNMFAMCGFGQNFPILVYVYQRSEEELNRIFMSGQGLQLGSEKANEFINQKQRSLDASMQY
jgi:jouberin